MSRMISPSGNIAEYKSFGGEQSRSEACAAANQYNIACWSYGDNPGLGAALDQAFQVNRLDSVHGATSLARFTPFSLFLVDLSGLEPFSVEDARAYLESCVHPDKFPVVIVVPDVDSETKMELLDLGCQDALDTHMSADEIVARLKTLIQSKIATENLKAQLDLASQTAYTAMSDNSDLGANIQFLLEANRCSNLDELGVLFFSIAGRYKLSISLQMRSAYGIKNMDPNGAVRELESQLLWQMQHAGRYVDFGRRTIMNYGCCSILVRNMPLHDEKRYGAIKDNVFAMLQGIDSRVIALDQKNKLLEEKVALARISRDLKQVMDKVDTSYQGVMRKIANTVESMAEEIYTRIPMLLLNEEQESFFEEVTSGCVLETNRVFNEGLKVDETFHQVTESMDKAIRSLEETQMESSAQAEREVAPPGDDGVELF